MFTIFTVFGFLIGNLINNISVVRNCGITTNENNTYFESDGSETGACTLRVCKVRNVKFPNFNIRVEMFLFQISGKYERLSAEA